MPVLLTLVALAALALGVLLGVAAAGRRRREPYLQQGPDASVDARPAAAAEPEPSPDRSLASLVVEALDHGVVVLDREERAVLVNPAARAMGILADDTLAFPGLIAVARRSLESATTAATNVDLPIGRLGREPIGLSVNAVPLLIGSDERVAAVCLLLTDVSENRRLEAVRRDFVANVSHELKTPVGALTLLAETIQDAADDAEAVHRFAGRIQYEGGRLAKLVDELMELSRVQGVDPMPGAGIVAIGDVVDEALDRTRLAAEQANITVTGAYSGTLEVRGNEAQLATALANLIDNAIAYSGSGTRVAVTAQLSTDIDARPTVDITVTDQGIGIAEGERERIFERFYRVDPARSRATGGTGLGLAIVKNIVTNHLGTVSVWSADRSGSTFTIRLPRVHSDRPSSATSDDGTPAHSAPVAARGNGRR